MPCACGGAKKTPMKYLYIDVKGQTHTYRTEIEAKAAKVRAGHVGRVEAVPA